MKIVFDKIHTKNKQEFLNKMMVIASGEAHKIPNHNKQLESCPICNSKKNKFFVEKFGFNLFRCAQCEQIFCNPMPTEHQLEKFYNSEMKEFENNFFIDSFEERIPIFDYRISRILNYISTGQILDIGSAVGIYLEALKRNKGHSFNIHSCEPSKDAFRSLSERFKEITLYNEWMENLNFSNKFTGITLWDTLEHLPNPVQSAKKINMLLKKGGYWFFSTPNTNSFEWEVTDKNHVQLLPPGHINLFNIKSIKKLLSLSGFKLISYETPNGSLDVTYIEKLINNEILQENDLCKFLKKCIRNKKQKMHFIDFLSSAKLAGNIFVTAQKV